jgi:prepilin-type processing-associated H-X9-DG protein
MKFKMIGFRSGHAGGVDFAFMDGSVQFLNDSTSDEVRKSIGTVAGSEAVTIQ